nr:hemicentin-1-like [Dermacentor andersoni]
MCDNDEQCAMKPSAALVWVIRLAFVAKTVTQPFSGAPKPESFGFSSYLRPGDEAVATCLLRKTSPEQTAELTWVRDGRPVTTSADRRVVIVKASQNSLTLAIRNVLVGDVGNYSCVADSEAGRFETTASLVLHALPSETTSVPKPQSLGFPPNLGLGDLAIVSCFVKGGTSPGQTLALWWDKDGREIVPDHRIEVHTTSASGGIVLSIRNLQPDDVGNYTCTVRSPGGSQGVTVPLVVTGDVP